MTISCRITSTTTTVCRSGGGPSRPKRVRSPETENAPTAKRKPASEQTRCAPTRTFEPFRWWLGLSDYDGCQVICSAPCGHGQQNAWATDQHGHLVYQVDPAHPSRQMWKIRTSSGGREQSERAQRGGTDGLQTADNEERERGRLSGCGSIFGCVTVFSSRSG